MRRLYLLIIIALAGMSYFPQLAAQERMFTSGFEVVGTHCGRADTFPCDRTIGKFVGRPDPENWTVDGSTGVQYRRATQEELNKNAWRPGTFLIDSSSIAGAAQGNQRINVLIPLEDGLAEAVSFDLLRANEGLQFVSRDAGVILADGGIAAEMIEPTQYEYVQLDFDRQSPAPSRGVWARMLAGEDGGVLMSGLLQGVEFELNSSSRGWHIDELESEPGYSAPSGSTVATVTLLSLGDYGGTQFSQCLGGGGDACDWLCDASAGVPCDDNPHTGPGSSDNHCSDNTDNDNDGTNNSGDEECKSRPEWGDDVHPGFPRREWESGKSMVLMGEGRFCTHYAGNWIQRLTRVGWDSEALMNSSRAFTGLSGGEMSLRYLGAGCWFFPTLDDANECRVDGTGCPSGYPYGGAGSTAANYYNHVWDDIDEATDYGWNKALHVAQTVYWGGTNASNGSVMSCSASEGSGCCGATFYPGSNMQRGASVVQYEISTGGCNASKAAASSAHEVGHTFGLDHDEFEGYMHSPSYTGSVISNTNRNLLMGCLASYNCPRPSGFRHTP